jgi:hypothetical protein
MIRMYVDGHPILKPSWPRQHLLNQHSRSQLKAESPLTQIFQRPALAERYLRK